MDPQTNIPAEQANPQTTGGSDTFSEQIATEKTVSEEAFVQNISATTQHNRKVIYYAIWAILLILVLSAVGIGSYVLWRNRQGLSDQGIASLFGPTRFDINPAETINIDGNGLLQINGDVNVSGTLSARFLQGDGSGITNLPLVATELPPFVAFVNADNQVFFGNNQIFRNRTDNTAAFSIQQASGNPVFSTNTLTNTGKFHNFLEVGNSAVQNQTILSSNYFGIEVNKTLSVQQTLTQTNPAQVYVANGNELLIKPINDPSVFGNAFAASYSAAEVDASSPWDYFLIGGNLNSISHSGSGTVTSAIGHLGLVNNTGSGTIDFAAGGVYESTISGSGDIITAAGMLTLNPAIFPGSTGTITTSTGVYVSNLFGSAANPQIGRQIGVFIDDQNASAIENTNLVSSGRNTGVNPGSINFLQGDLVVGTPSDAADLALYTSMKTIGNPTRVVVGTDGTGVSATYDPLATVQINNSGASSKALVIQNTTGGTGDLTQWQSATGSVLARVTSSGAVGIGVTPTSRLDVLDTSDDTPASFTGTSGTCTVDTFAGGWSCVSDQNLKENILQISSATDIITQLNGVTFNWKGDTVKAQVAGFIAQEVQKVLPGLVSELSDGTLSLNKDGMIPYLVEAIKEQNGQIEQINNQIAAYGISLESISNELQNLAARIEKLEGTVLTNSAQINEQQQRIDTLEAEIKSLKTTVP